MHHVLFNVLYDRSKLLVIAENNVLGQKVRKYAKNRGKLGNLIFCMIFPFQRMLNNAVCTVPCIV